MSENRDSILIKAICETLDRSSVAKMCENAGFSKIESGIILLHYCDRDTVDNVAYDLGISLSTYHRVRKMLASKVSSFVFRNSDFFSQRESKRILKIYQKALDTS